MTARANGSLALSGLGQGAQPVQGGGRGRSPEGHQALRLAEGSSRSAVDPDPGEQDLTRPRYRAVGNGGSRLVGLPPSVAAVQLVTNTPSSASMTV